VDTSPANIAWPLALLWNWPGQFQITRAAERAIANASSPGAP
jgi:hypothetical protein